MKACARRLLVPALVLAGLLVRRLRPGCGGALLGALLASEAALALLLLWRLRGALRSATGWEAAGRVLQVLFPDRVAALALAELRVLLACLRPLPSALPSGLFTTVRTSDYRRFLIGVLVLVLCEAPVVHLAIYHLAGPGGLRPWLHGALLASNLYLLMWLWGDYRLMAGSGHRLGPLGLELALGLRWSGLIPYAAIASMERPTREVRGEPLTARVSPADRPNVILHLREQVTLRYLTCLERSAQHIHLFIDEPARLMEGIAQAKEETCRSPEPPR